jgi:hypothetical protein
VLIDSTIARAHQHSSGARKTGPQSLERSRGGLTTKLHLAVDDDAHPLRLIATDGQVFDIRCANGLVEHLRTRALIADKSFADLTAAHTWVTHSVHRHNHEHRHSGIRYVSPAQRHGV